MSQINLIINDSMILTNNSKIQLVQLLTDIGTKESKGILLKETNAKLIKFCNKLKKENNSLNEIINKNHNKIKLLKNKCNSLTNYNNVLLKKERIKSNTITKLEHKLKSPYNKFTSYLYLIFLICIIYNITIFVFY